MYHLGIFTGNDLKQKSKAFLIEHFGKSGDYYFNVIRGIHTSPVEPIRLPKSIGTEHTFKENLTSEIYLAEKIKEILVDIGANFLSLANDKLLDFTSDKLAEGKAVGWFQNKMEFGPRALGGRSILGDARSPEMQKKLNLKVKFRESFRPFAPAVLLEDVNEWFDLESESPYMLLVGKVKEDKLIDQTSDQKLAKGLEKLNIARSKIPAVTHVDNSARIQTVTAENGIYYDLIKSFKKKTGCPVIVNTSFNVRGEPPVNTPIDAYKCFMATDLDLLVLGNCVMEKHKQINFNLNIK